MRLPKTFLIKFLPAMLLAGLLSGCGDDDGDVKISKQKDQQQEQVKQSPVEQQPQVVYVQADPQQPQAVQQNQQPQTIVVQQPQYDSTGNLITGMVLGHMMSNMSGGGGGYSSERTVNNKTVINKTYVNKNPSTSPPSYYGNKGNYSSSLSSVRSRSFSNSGYNKQSSLKISTKKPSYYKSKR